MAITLDTSQSSTPGISTTSTISYTVGADGTNRLLVVGCEYKTILTPLAVTYAGVSLTPLPIVQSATTKNVWYLFAPTTGTNNIVITWNSNPAASTTVAIASYRGVMQSPPLTVGQTSGTGTSVSLSTLVVDSTALLVDIIRVQTTGIGITATNSQVLLGCGDTAHTGQLGYILSNNAGTTNYGYSWTGSLAYTYANAIFLAATLSKVQRVNTRPHLFSPGLAR